MTETLTGNPKLVTPNFAAPPRNPLLMLQEWLEEAEKLGLHEPRSLVLSTANKLHQPSSRVVFLRGWDEKGIIFATSQTSRKGKDLQENPYAAGTLWWRETLQQINFQGQVVRMSDEQSEEIFQARTREAQSISVVFQQSAPLMNEEKLKEEVQKCMEGQGKIDRPKDWHAYHLAIESIEFWHGSTDRMHKRLRYDLEQDSWRYQLIQP